MFEVHLPGGKYKADGDMLQVEMINLHNSESHKFLLK